MLSSVINKIPFNVGKIHLIGIGGIGMSGIAEILHNLGCQIQGSDISKNNNVQRLEKLGIKVFIGHNKDFIKDAQLVVKSSAVSQDNEEIIEAYKNSIPVISRAEMLAEIMRLKSAIAIAGSHGKTTTTSMVANLFEVGEKKPTIINGGILNSKGTNAYLGEGQWIISEADESDGSFIKLPKNIGVVTNIDVEHLEFYENFDNLISYFITFLQEIPFYGFSVVCTDNEILYDFIYKSKKFCHRKIYTYGFKHAPDVRAFNIKSKDNGMIFDIELSKKICGSLRVIEGLYLSIAGKHNVLNSLAMIAIGVSLGFSDDCIKKALSSFAGVKRRLTNVSTIAEDVVVIDDYAHHPVELNAVFEAISNIKGEGRLIAIVQPHRYSRLRELFDDFAESLTRADLSIVLPVYAAGEEEIIGINHTALVTEAKKKGANVKGCDSFAEVTNYLKKIVEQKDIVVGLGAGDITNYINDLPQKWDKKWDKK